MRLGDIALDHLRGALADPALPPDLTGTKYELGEELGRGGMGVVYRARDRELDREVALKVLLAPSLEEQGTASADGSAPAAPPPDLAARLMREARVLAQLEHPGIVPVHDVGRLADGRVFTVMKWVRGNPLSAYVAEPRPANRRAAQRLLVERLRLFLKILDAVGFAHARGIVHRDLKPANVMVGAFGEVLVMDWGLAKLLSDSAGEALQGSSSPGAATGSVGVPAGAAVTAAGAVLGTPGYMAPEQERGDTAAVDARSDVYALGAILADLVAGLPTPVALAAIVRRARATAAEHRYPTVLDLAADVERFLAREPVAAHRERLFELIGRWYSKYETPILLVLVYLLLRALFLVWPRAA